MLRFIGLLSMLSACAATPAPPGSTPTDPEAPDAGVTTEHDATTTPHGYTGAYKSPSIVAAGSTYHAFFAADRVAGAHRNMPHATFTAAGDWTFVGDALPELGAGADPDGAVWAPGVAQISPTRWVAFYTAHLAGTVSKMCIWRAHAASADGPFVDDHDGPIVCPSSTQWAIDAYLVKDGQGDWNLAARVDLPGGINTIQLRKLDASADDFADGSTWSTLTQNAPDSWEQPVLENAGVVRLSPLTAPPRWFVFYSGGAWDNNTYAVGYADCGPSIAGPCTKKTPNGPWLATDAAAGLFGPGTPTFYKSETGEQMMSVQAWQYSGGKQNPQNDKGQIMRTYSLTVSDDYVPTATLVRIDK
jgi:hypothetical protein